MVLSIWTTTWYRVIGKANHDALMISPIHNQSSEVKIYKGNKNNDIARRDLTHLVTEEYKEISRATLRLHDSQNVTCKCVRCKEDPLCGRLWQGNQPFGEIEGASDSIYKVPIHVVVSYCMGDLNYITAMTEGYDIKSIHVISKCGYPVVGVPVTASIEILPNVGRCDHGYAHYLLTVLDQKIKEQTDPVGPDTIVVFLKDNAGARNLHQLGRWNSFSNMVEVASSKAGFACGMVPEVMYREKPRFWLAAHFDLESLKEFKIKQYGSKSQYDSDNVMFDSAFPTWGSFYDHLGAAPLEREMVQVCFGGVFAASLQQIKKQPKEVWSSLKESLSRGDNIQEGHYAERMWGMFLALPLEQYQVEAIKEFADNALRPGYHKKYGGTGSVLGAIVKKVQMPKQPSKACSSSRHCWKK